MGPSEQPVTEFRRVQTHTVYRLTDGTVVPGTTTVVNELAKPALIHWAWRLGTEGLDYRKHRDQAAEVGTLTHLMVLRHFTGQEPDLSTFTPEQVAKARRAFGKFEDWLQRNDIQDVRAELPLVSERWRYGGTVDVYGYVNGVPTLLDCKTGGALRDEHLYQVAAYHQLLREHGHPVKRIILLRIGREDAEGFDERPYRPRDLAPHWRIFRHALAIWWERKRLKGEGL